MTHRDREYAKRLKIAAKALQKKPITSVELADRLGVSKPTAYALIQALLRRGFDMKMTITRAGSRGPQAHAFQVTKWGTLDV